MHMEKEQVKALAPAAAHHCLDTEATAAIPPPQFMTRRHRTCINCIGCLFAILSIVAVILLVLSFTVFHIKDPILTIDYSNIRAPGNQTGPDRFLNMRIEADVSIRNPNMASFKFSNLTTNMYYGGTVIGRSGGWFGEVRARKTLRMNVPIGLVGLDEILEIGNLPISSYTRVSGRVKISGGNKRRLVVRMNCTMKLNVRRERVEDKSCRVPL